MKAKQDFSKHRSKRLEVARQFIESKGCKLLSTEYVDAKKPLLLQCSCGKEYKKSFHKFKDCQSYTCQDCSKERRARKRSNSYQEVYDYIKSTGCELISKEYKNSSSILDIKCVCGKIFKRKFTIFRSSNSQKCDDCGHHTQVTSRLLGINEVRKDVESKGCKLVSTEYKKLNQKLDLICKCGRPFKISYLSIRHQNSQDCPTCTKRRMFLRNITPFPVVKARIESTGCKLISTSYTSPHKKLRILCGECGKEFERTYAAFSHTNKPCCPACSYRDSEPEKEMKEFLKTELGIDNLISKDTKLLHNKIGGKELDILLPDYKLAIEINGIFWHLEQNGKDHHYHRDKTIACNIIGYNLIHITDHEWNESKDKIKSLLRIRLGKGTTVPARKCILKEIPKEEAKKFINANHLQNWVYSDTQIGLYYNNELVSIMTFGRARFNKNYQNELLRLCSKLNTVVVGGAERMFKYYLNKYKPENLISHCDLSKFTGKTYTKIGLQFKNYSKPGYFYFKNNEVHSRFKFQKKLQSDKIDIFDQTLSEKQNMRNNGYGIYYDCGNANYHWIKS